MTGKIELSKDIKMRIFKYKSNSKSKLFKKKLLLLFVHI